MINYPKNNIGLEIIPLTIINKTNRDNLYLYLDGTTNPKEPKNNHYHLKDLQGNVEKSTPTQGEVTYSILLPKEQTIQLKLPRLSGMRMYFSFDKPLYVTNDNGIPSSPAGWLKDESNYQILFDWIEMTWEVNSSTDMTLGGNTTQVDMFGLPFCLELKGFDANGNEITQKSGFNADGVRNKIISAIKDAPSPWKHLVISSETTNFDNRVISPYHGIEMKLFPENQLDDYIDQVWTKYEIETLIATAENTEFDGKIIQGNLVFTPRDSDNQSQSITFPKPSTFEIYMSGPNPKENSSKANVIRAALQAGFMRTTLLINNNLPACDSPYYQNPPVNLYAQSFHKYGIDHKAYGFGFDDVCNDSSFIIVHNPESVEITLSAF